MAEYLRDMLNLAISSDANGFAIYASLLASILRRSSSPLHVRCWCRGFLPNSFEQGMLKVEFFPAEDRISGCFPKYVGPAVFDRLRVIDQADDWDRCLILDYDQLVFCDLVPLFGVDLGDHLLAAKMQGPGVDLAYAMKEWLKRPIPRGWEHAAGNPYFSMGPLLNLTEMRKSGTWEKLLAAQQAFRADENLALVAATEGRTMEFDRKWNLFAPKELEGIEVPDGVVHWLGWPKPWHEGANVWRPELWESERCSWEHLRMGLWEKPVTVEVEPDDDHGVEELLKRGWKVRMFTGRKGAGKEELPAFRYPDLEVVAAAGDGFPNALREICPRGKSLGKLERVRFGPWVRAAEWLGSCGSMPRHIALRGPVAADELREVVALGYGEACRIRFCDWASGGPMPRALGFSSVEEAAGLDGSEELYLRWTGAGPVRSEDTLGKRQEGSRTNGAGAGAATRTSPDGPAVAVVVAALGNEQRHLRHLLETLRMNFLSGVRTKIFVFTDDNGPEDTDSSMLRIEDSGKGSVDLKRYRWILQCEHEFEEFDLVLLLKPHVRMVERVDLEEIASDGLVACLHSAYAGEPRVKIRFEENEASVAWVAPEEGLNYHCGSWQGGGRRAFFDAVRTIAGWIEEDEANGVRAYWGDESYWNRYLIDLPPERTLGPEFAWRIGTKVRGRPPKVQVLPRREAGTSTSNAGQRRVAKGRVRDRL